MRLKIDIDTDWLKKTVDQALKEDIGEGDITTSIVVDEDLWAAAEIIAQDKGVLAGIEVARVVFLEIDDNIEFDEQVQDGEELGQGQVVASLKGRAASILTAERVALNFLSLLSGVATTTRAFVERTKGYGVKILDTRKTTPLLRPMQRYAVRKGGGENHREGLAGGILIKDNHLQAIDLTSAVQRARKQREKEMEIEVEAHTLDQVREAILAKPEIIMLDNMGPETLKEAVGLIRNRAPEILIEVSGGITLENVEEVARQGVDMISIGSLTHSSRALDLSLEIKRCFYP